MNAQGHSFSLLNSIASKTASETSIHCKPIIHVEKSLCVHAHAGSSDAYANAPRKQDRAVKSVFTRQSARMGNEQIAPSEVVHILPEGEERVVPTMRQRLGAWDKNVSRRVYNASYQHTRFLLLLLEFSGHGVLWVVVPALFYLFLPHVSPPVSGILLNYLGVAVLDLVVIAIVKPVVGRQRPEHNGGMTAVTIQAIDQYSFPSGHATRAGLNAAFVVYLQSATPDSLSPFFRSSFFLAVVLIWAAAVAVSRVALGRHHVLDVFAGLLMGILYVLAWQLLWISDSTAHSVRTYLRHRLALS